MTSKLVSLDDKFDLSKDEIFVSGTQAIIRLCLMQKARDKSAGRNTAGYVTGYRGSPLGAVDQQMWRAKKWLEENDIVFQPGLNEDLAATACWGTQQAELRGEGKFDGVFSLWYGKGPGVDRSGDVLRHANLAGTSPNGGVLVLMGDDHISESSTTAHQSDFALVDSMIPFLYPAGVQEIVDYGLYGWALSRYSGCWTGLKLIKDTVDTTASISVDLERLNIVYPEIDEPEGGRNIRLWEWPLEAEARLHDYKKDAALEFIKANKLNKTILKGGSDPRLGLVTTGKSYLDVRQALDDLGIDETKAAKLGIALLKVASPYPLVVSDVTDFGVGLQKLMVVEEKRSLIESQVKEQLYGHTDVPQIVGKRDEHDNWLFPAKNQLDPNMIALAIADRVLDYAEDEEVMARASAIREAEAAAARNSELVTRTPYYCAGCPHNTSTKVPDGSRAYAGIGCHWMAQLMPDRETLGYTQMGGEGANWIGEAPFSNTGHVFQNLGDGTYNHSGILAVRAAIASNTTITYKILYNDAVAMTGGQPNDGGLSVNMIVAQVIAEGAKHVVVVSDEPDKYAADFFPASVPVHGREKLDEVQVALRKVEGVTVVVYDQTCAAEKRRRRKRGTYPDPAKRIFINDLVCEGCGDCGVKSNCVAVVPLETEWGRKRQIDQSACNKDYSCAEGFCPSFVTVTGGKLRKGAGAKPADPNETFPPIPEPELPSFRNQYSIVVTGIGGTGVVTIGALIGMAAHLEGKGCGILDMAGLAQKGGAVISHIRIAETRDTIQAIRVPAGGADLVLGSDLVVTGAAKTLATMARERTSAVINTAEVMTGAFTHDPDFSLPTERVRLQIEAQTGEENTHFIAATRLATGLMGDSIAANMFLLGYAWQKGLVPLAEASILQAIEMNGVAAEMNARAFLWGRRAAHDIATVAERAGPALVVSDREEISTTLDDIIARRETFLTAYQNKRYARRYGQAIAAVREAEQSALPGTDDLTRAAAKSLFKLMAIKDEYEVARLFTNGEFEKKLKNQFEGDYTLTFHLAPPKTSKKNKRGELIKSEYPQSMMKKFRMLARMKRLRGTLLDPFRRSAERKAELGLLKEFETLLTRLTTGLTADNHAIAVELATIPQRIRGYGHVKTKAMAEAKEAEISLLEQFQNPGSAPMKEAAE